ncbi:MAG: hypothetical protein JWR55_1105 [Aeromicrobium sp.]|jgi:hypothetical protein|nr:hypothetical protein [Aeromicrobium sp.]
MGAIGTYRYREPSSCVHRGCVSGTAEGPGADAPGPSSIG